MKAERPSADLGDGGLPEPVRAGYSVPADLEESPTVGSGLHNLELIGLGLLLIATFLTLYYARAVFLPIALAFLLNFLLTPLLRTTKELGVPNTVSAFVVIALGLALIAGAASQLVPPAVKWLDRLPEVRQRLKEELDWVQKPLRKIDNASQNVSTGSLLAAPDVPEDEPQVEVELETPEMNDRLLDQVSAVLTEVVVTIILLFFLLASGDNFLRKLVEVMPRLPQKKKAVELVHSIERGISTYLLTVTAINCGLGACVGAAMWLLGMPDPWLWGAMATLLNFVPYLGAIVGVAVIGMVAIATFNDTSYALLVPLTYYLLTAIEGNFVTPVVLGYRLDLNPVVIFMWLLLWGWMWQIAGTLLAVPLLAVVKIICDHVRPLHPVSKFLVR